MLSTISPVRFEKRFKAPLSQEEKSARIEKNGEYAGLASALGTVAGLNGWMNRGDDLSPYLLGTALGSFVSSAGLYVFSPSLEDEKDGSIP